MRRAGWGLSLFVVATLSGCVMFEVGVTNPVAGLTTVAVAPFFNLSEERSVDGRRFAQAYFSELQKTPGFQVVPVGVVEQAIYDHQLEMNDPQDALTLARVLDVDAVVVGAVTDYSPYYPPRIGLQVSWYSPQAWHFHPGIPTDEWARDLVKPRAWWEWWGPRPKSHKRRWETCAVSPPASSPDTAARQQVISPRFGETCYVMSPLDADQPIFSERPLREDRPALSEGNFLEDRSRHEERTPLPPWELPAHRVATRIATADRQEGVAAAAVVRGQSSGVPPLEWQVLPEASLPAVATTAPAFDPHQPLMSYTRLFDGADPKLTARLRDYVELHGDLRAGGWEAYLHRSEDFIRFTAHLMVVEMLQLHGGEAQRRVVLKFRRHP